MHQISLEGQSMDNIALLFGTNDENIRVIEDACFVNVVLRDNFLTIVSQNEDAKNQSAIEIIESLLEMINDKQLITLKDITFMLAQKENILDSKKLYQESIIKTYKGKHIYCKTAGQYQYLQALQTHDVCFCSGSAGSGKTYLAVVYGASLLKQKKVEKIILVRPAVEAGENLGFLPGDLKEKVDPYLRPLYDALHDVFGKEMVEKLIERGVIEIAPLAYMRGRTLDDAFVILDEAQNTTIMQMKMFLTRLGFNSKMIITGDTSQIDLPRGVKSGLVHANHLLRDVSEIAFITLTIKDVVRHPIVSKIIETYERENKDE